MLSSDFWLVRRARSGDQQAFGVLYRRHAPRIYNLLRRLCQNDATAEDLTQETFLSAHRNLASWRGTGSLAPWLCGIAVGCNRTAQRNASKQSYREESLTDTAEDTFADNDPLSDPLAHCTLEEGRRLLDAAIADLPALCREAFVLVYVEELSYREAAQAMGVPVGTVQSRLNRAKRLLHARLSADLVSETPPPSSAVRETAVTFRNEKPVSRQQGGDFHVV